MTLEMILSPVKVRATDAPDRVEVDDRLVQALQPMNGEEVSR